MMKRLIKSMIISKNIKILENKKNQVAKIRPQKTLPTSISLISF
jgi:hypothetical protein